MKRHSYIAVGLAIASLSVAAGMVVALEAEQPLPADVGDLSAVTRIEVKDSAGTVWFNGQFGEPVEKNGERERKAVLTGTGGATCEAEIETRTTAGRTHQELEVDVAGLPPGTTLSVTVDDRPVATFTTDAKGKGEIELSGASGQ
jgi:hypothetical protein